MQRLNQGLQQMGQGFQAMSQELTLIGNIPAIAGGQAILAAIQTLDTNLSQRLMTLDNRLTALDNRVIALDTRVTTLDTNITQRLASIENQIRVADRNHAARLYNGPCNAPNSILTSLFHHRTGAAIALFPATVGDISTMNSADVNIVLTALDQEATGNLAARRARLLKTVGVLVQTI